MSEVRWLGIQGLLSFGMARFVGVDGEERSADVIAVTPGFLMPFNVIR